MAASTAIETLEAASPITTKKRAVSLITTNKGTPLTTKIIKKLVQINHSKVVTSRGKAGEVTVSNVGKLDTGQSIAPQVAVTPQAKVNQSAGLCLNNVMTRLASIARGMDIGRVTVPKRGSRKGAGVEAATARAAMARAATARAAMANADLVTKRSLICSKGSIKLSLRISEILLITFL